MTRKSSFDFVETRSALIDWRACVEIALAVGCMRMIYGKQLGFHGMAWLTAVSERERQRGKMPA